MQTKHSLTGRLRRLRPTPALVVAFVALFAAMGGIGYATAKLKPNSVKAKNIKPGAVTSDKLADGAVTTPKLSPDAVAPNALSAMNAANADKLGGVAPGHCQLGWLKASVVVNTGPLTPANPDIDVPGFDCASGGTEAIHVHRDDVGRYTVTFPGLETGTVIAGIAGGAPPNAVTAASVLEDGGTAVKTWNNPNEGAFVDGMVFSLVVF
jgi:hypothetical protein